ncbi:MAG: hypothetical protein L6Q99_05700 [Planctomycetes bacterium]|nr:hypothetical protein [Planctomycetota bacterium]
MTNSKPVDQEQLLAQSGWVRSLARTLVRVDDVDDLVESDRAGSFALLVPSDRPAKLTAEWPADRRHGAFEGLPSSVFVVALDVAEPGSAEVEIRFEQVAPRPPVESGRK